MATRIYDDSEVDQVRTSELIDGDVLACGRAPGWGGYTGHPILRAGDAGWSAEWGCEVWSVTRADGRSFTQPGKFWVTIVRRDLAVR